MVRFCLRLVISFTLALGIIFSSSHGTAIAFTLEQNLYLDAWRIVNEAYLDETFNHQNWWKIREKRIRKPIDTTEEAYRAIEEMLAGLDDPYTRLLRPDQYRSLKINTSGELSGVGLQININPDNGMLEVVAPLADSPAEHAGIAPLDQIMAIDGVPTRELSLDEAAAKMRGPIGSNVILSIQTPGQDLRDVTLTRDRIELSALTYRLDTQVDNFPVGYLKLSQFSASAYGEMVEALKTLEAKGAKGYILDLRNNPGGLLQAGIEIARLWLDSPSTVVYTVDRQGTLDSFEAEGTMMTHAPLVVLVNKGTASASEILAGALQDNNRAILVGDTTFGKGLIQSLFELRNGAGLAVTIAQYETPDHHNINKLGIAPDLQISQQPITFQQIGTPDDMQYQAALQQLQGS